MQRSILAALIATLLLGFVPVALAKDLRGVALVIGESDYDSDKLRDLGNPKNDARAMDDLLGKLGFEVDRALNDNHADLEADIKRFLRDAKGADVALVYYSGHGIEAGGEDYLVPTDADLSNPSSAGSSLVPLKELIDQLAKTVPVTITLLDACRTNAFPAGTTIELPGTNQTLDVATTGLGALRGPMPVAQTGTPDDNLGTVIGFAAAPGQAALDGEAGSNSPYATALLKHLGAGGYAFGDVMTMVSEEVYLKTGGRQLPWINSSLRRVLSFGAALPALDPDDAAITGGRRKLLLTIASLSDADRRQVEAAAHAADVPMDALYGLLEVLGQQVPSDPNVLQQLLSEQTVRLKTMLSERAALTSSDPEITRFAGLAQKALDEGALKVSIDFWEQAKARYAVIEQTLDATEANLKARRLGGGALLARTADAYALSGDYRNAADNYGQAFDQVSKWDIGLAYDYKLAQANTLQNDTMFTGNLDSVEAALPLFRQSLEIARTGLTANAWAMAQNNYGSALELVGERLGDLGMLSQAAAAFDATLSVWTYASDPRSWLIVKNNLAALLNEIGQLSPSGAELQQSVDAYRDVLRLLHKADDPFSWAMTEANLGNALGSVGERHHDTQALHDAIDAFRQSLAAIDRNVHPDEWAFTQTNMGTNYAALGNAGEPGTFDLAVAAYRAALDIDTPERSPVQWVADMNNLGIVLESQGEQSNDLGKVGDAIDSYRAALRYASRDDEPVMFGKLQANLAKALYFAGMAGTGTEELEGAVTAGEQALAVAPKTGLGNIARIENQLGDATVQLGIRRHDQGFARRGRDLLADAWKKLTAAGENYDKYYKRHLAQVDIAINALK